MKRRETINEKEKRSGEEENFKFFRKIDFQIRSVINRGKNFWSNNFRLVAPRYSEKLVEG